MGTPSMSRTADVFVVDVGDDENMTSVAWVAAMNELLDEVEAAEGPKARHHLVGTEALFQWARHAVDGDG